MKTRKSGIRLLAWLMLAVMLASCSSKPAVDNGQGADSNGESENTRTFAIVFPLVHPWFDPIEKSAKEYANEHGWNIIIRAPEAPDAQMQIDFMEELIEMGVDGIAIAPANPDIITDVIVKAIDAGIKIICFDGDVPDSGRMGYVGTDNYIAGRHMGHVLGRTLAGEGDILILSGISVHIGQNDRIQGVMTALTDHYPGINILDMQFSEADFQRAVDVTQEMVRAHPNFDAIIGIDSTAGYALISVWEEMGWKSDDKPIITFDDMSYNLQGLRDGYITAIIAQRQNVLGEGLILLLNSLVEGRPIPEYTDTKTIEVTMSNINSYFDEESWIER